MQIDCKARRPGKSNHLPMKSKNRRLRHCARGVLASVKGALPRAAMDAANNCDKIPTTSPRQSFGHTRAEAKDHDMQFNTREVCEFLSVDDTTLKRWIKQ